ncbi:radical SAM domain protein [Prevotella disiens JCM 6334 = ATCC 29426]|uniref:Anaerobic sulfatase-maturating enzyme homolog YdeM n=3 Tax=Prevotella disiens TaxID=28130 RepID=A0A379E0W8_9BACT|nr:radical SAM protein [Prevotella disiens]ERJ80920.1 radical SAM domain protein [Prevotella disiens JCM 6334 = ATCC 29426]MDU2114568.1 4Fe-4S cluster-binding domain-containing protein [Prevotella bivia]SUB85981.1 Anaerobic sulfatase-maturating enzyme homolog YdeM [Prevotella disiens]
MVNLKETHIITKDNETILFHYPSYTLISINDHIKEILEMIKSGISLSEISLKKNILEADIKKLLVSLNKVITKNLLCKEKGKEIKEGAIHRITLHISNDCNLRCKYCYANGGNYNLHRHLMTKETAKNFYDFCINNFHHIEKIVFFGGEPCINVDVMEYLCSLFYNYKFDKSLEELPKFGIITNGTIWNERLISVIKKYITFITVSIDGEKKINDSNRVDKQGKGTYNRIAKFIDYIKHIPSVKVQYEATYTKQHIKENITKDDISLFFRKRFNIEGFLVDEISIEEDNHKIDFSVQNVDNLPECFTDILWAISFKHHLESCQISRLQFAVSTSGLIYPCHMDVGIESLNLGDVKGDNIFNSKHIQDHYPLFNLINNKEKLCPNCWCQNLCECCPKSFFYDNEAKKYSLTPNTDKCKYQREYIEKILIAIVKLRKNKGKWQEYVNEINKKQNLYEY